MSRDFQGLPDDMYRQILVNYIDGLERRLDAAEETIRAITRGHYQTMADDTQFRLEAVATPETNRAGIDACKAVLRHHDDIHQAFHGGTYDPIYGRDG